MKWSHKKAFSKTLTDSKDFQGFCEKFKTSGKNRQGVCCVVSYLYYNSADWLKVVAALGGLGLKAIG